jgi:hypothetical protein
LRNYFSLVLITERYEESVNLIEKTFQWKNITRLWENPTKNKTSLSDISPQTIESIKRMNSLDIELYNFALKIFYFGWKLKILSI